MNVIRDFLGHFWGRVDVGEDDACWPWTGYLGLSNGYGRLWVRGRQLESHRVVWELTSGLPIPPGLCVLHSCDNPACVNPAHLRVGTHADNSRDMVERHRHPLHNKTRCKHGHRLDDQNVFLRSDGRRICRACGRARHKRAPAAPPVPAADGTTSE